MPDDFPFFQFKEVGGGQALAVPVRLTPPSDLPAALGGTPIEAGILAVLHFGLLLRIRMARQAAAVQRAADLERFASLKANRGS